MFRIIAINTDSTTNPTNPQVVCNGLIEEANPPIDEFYLSSHHSDLDMFMMVYTDTFKLMQDVQRLHTVVPSTDLGIQARGANGEWYLYDFNRQNEHVTDLVNLK